MYETVRGVQWRNTLGGPKDETADPGGRVEKAIQ